LKEVIPLRKLHGFVLILVVLTVLGTASQAAQASPALAAVPGYTLITSFSSDPANGEYTASFAPDVLSIFAWAMIAADGGAPEKQFQLDAQFFSPVGQKVDSKWYAGDTGAVTSGPAVTLASTGSTPTKNMARRQLDLGFTAYEKLTGQWTVVFSVDGKTAVVESFIVATQSELAASDNVGQAQKELEQQGYTVIKSDVFTPKDSARLYAELKMTMVSPDLYSAQVSRQITDGFAALRKGYPDAKVLEVELEYDARYEVWYLALADDWDTYVKSKNWTNLVKALVADVYDKDELKLLKSGAKDFINKNFGAGSIPLPLGAPGLKQGSVGSIRAQVSPLSLPADGLSLAQFGVTVFDKRNRTLANAPLTFRLSGLAAGTLDPKAGRTAGLGQAAATFRSGKKEGAMALTATNGTTNATVLLTLGQGSKDTATDNVFAYLSAQGYLPVDVQSDKTRAAARVVVDLPTFDVQQVPAVILDGVTALREYYPDAATLEIAILYRKVYWLVFTTSAANADQLFTSTKEAGGEKAKLKVVLQSFLNPVLDKAMVVDTRTNQPLGLFKDVLSKSFGG